MEHRTFDGLLPLLIFPFFLFVLCRLLSIQAKAQSAEQLAAQIELTGEEFNQDKFAEAQISGQSWGQAADGDDADAW